MITIVLVVAAGVAGYGLVCWANAARQGRGAEWRRAFMRAWRSDKRRRTT